MQATAEQQTEEQAPETEEADTDSLLDDLRAMEVDEMLLYQVDDPDVAQRAMFSVRNLHKRFPQRYRTCYSDNKLYVIRFR